jgi:sugar transferase (PEP-CTERM/EpsH1 system associated)
MKEFRPHIVHSRNFGALEAVPAARLAGVPVVIHSEHGYEVETISGLPLRRRLLCRVFYAMTDSVFTVTKDLRSYHAAQSWLPESLFRVVYNGVNTLRFAPHPGVRDKVRSALGISQSSFVIGCVSRLVPIKDHGTLLRAAEKLIGQGKDVQVLLAGAGPEREKLEAYASASPSLQGKVIFVGSSDRVPELLNAMDVFVLASLCEGMSNTILEAMATGLPIVGSNAGGNAELTEDGKTGFLFTPHDVETLTRRLQQLIEDVELRQEFGFAARERALKIFDISRMIDTYRNLYFELAANREPRKKVQG